MRPIHKHLGLTGLVPEKLFGRWLVCAMFFFFCFASTPIFGQGFEAMVEDSDGDGIPDEYDLCPQIQEDLDNFLDTDGCPEPDNDGDGIPDFRDECPMVKELVNGYRDGDGCPDGNQWSRPASPVIDHTSLIDDADGDRVRDMDDLCPDAQEDHDNFQDTDGCPDYDNDGDKIPDYRDNCPLVPERVNGVDDTDGCPETETDEDSDGVADFKDMCPLEPETSNGIRDSDGCPEGFATLLVITPLHASERMMVQPSRASDEQRAAAVNMALIAYPDPEADGVAEDMDLCPNAAEDLDGFQDADGCPDLDNDNDGLEDSKDQCPDEAEVENGFWDSDGCPDSAEESLARLSGVIDGLHFQQGSDLIQKRSDRVLVEAVEVMLANPVLKLTITGHTDNEGDRENNIELSQKRAESVRKRFLDLGIAETRVVAVGRGPDKPIASNGTDEGRAKNRRVEFDFSMSDNSE